MVPLCSGQVGFVDLLHCPDFTHGISLCLIESFYTLSVPSSHSPDCYLLSFFHSVVVPGYFISYLVVNTRSCFGLVSFIEPSM